LCPVISRSQAVCAGPVMQNLGLFRDYELKASLRFGERQMLLREVLDLNAGSIVELDHKICDPVELLVGGRVVARGDAVVMDGNYARFITEIVNPRERMETLGG
jgi:flagellar motor switch protein FliN/FliY